MLCKMRPLGFRPGAGKKNSLTIQEVASLIICKLHKIISPDQCLPTVRSRPSITPLMNCDISGLGTLHPSKIMTLKTVSLLIANGGWWLLACAIRRAAVSAWVNVPVLIPANHCYRKWITEARTAANPSSVLSQPARAAYWSRWWWMLTFIAGSLLLIHQGLQPKTTRWKVLYFHQELVNFISAPSTPLSSCLSL